MNNNPIDLTTFGEQVKKLRKNRGWNQSELARRANMTSAGLSFIEAGKGIPRRSSVKAIAAALGITEAGIVVNIDKHLPPPKAEASKVQPSSTDTQALALARLIMKAQKMTTDQIESLNLFLELNQ